ncbi:hypothetical protein [Planococcus dechangensis]|uniref:Uncharacterized protein n=1 Tax=Planococcus dechangensis TaxID=1176255 RepID=A0ABV9MCB3_9BACL
MRTYWLFIIGLLVHLSLLIINDFFPGTLAVLGIPMWLVLAVIAGLVVAVLIRDSGEREKYFHIIFPVLMYGYPISLIAFLVWIGGESSYGISLTSSALWIPVAVSAWHMYSLHDEAIKQETSELEK